MYHLPLSQDRPLEFFATAGILYVYSSILYIKIHVVTICRWQKWVQNARHRDIRSITPDHLYKSYHLCKNCFEESQFKNKDNKKAENI